MAKIRAGSLAGNIRGSIGGDTFSQNRYGTYVRRRAIPTVVRTMYTEQVRNAFGVCSQAWQTLTYDQQEMWKTWAKENPITDKFGEQQILSGNCAFIKLNSRIVRLGYNWKPLPPGKTAPPNIEQLALSSMSDTKIEINTTPSTLDTNLRLQIFAHVSDTLGAHFIENKMRVIKVTMKTAASPIDIKPDLEGRFGTLQKGWVVYIRAYTLDIETGLKSGPASLGLLYDYEGT